MKKRYTIYGLKVHSGSKYFYIGVSSYTIYHRMSMHLSSVRCGYDTNLKKSEVIRKCGFKITVHPIKEFVGTKAAALELESKYIMEYINDGHPLTNYVPEFKSTKPIRISSSIHKKLRVYAAKADVNIVDVVDQAVINFMKEFPASFIVNNTTKTKKQ